MRQGEVILEAGYFDDLVEQRLVENGDVSIRLVVVDVEKQPRCDPSRLKI